MFIWTLDSRFNMASLNKKNIYCQYNIILIKCQIYVIRSCFFDHFAFLLLWIFVSNLILIEKCIFKPLSMHFRQKIQNFRIEQAGQSLPLTISTTIYRIFNRYHLSIRSHFLKFECRTESVLSFLLSSDLSQLSWQEKNCFNLGGSYD